MLPDRMYGEVQLPLSFPTLTRGRDTSVSSQNLRRGWHETALLRPSTAIPNYSLPDTLVARQHRDMTNFKCSHLTRKDREYSPNWTENAPSPATDDSKEVRASFKSGLTSNSSYLDASGTQRSSVVTKCSSISDVTKDTCTATESNLEEFSVDDAIGMYAAGFGEDDEDLDCAGVETPSKSEEQLKQINEMAQVMEAKVENRELALPPPRVLLRSSAAIFSGSDLPSDPPSALSTVMSASETRDRYGFRKATQHVTLKQYAAWDKGYTEYLKQRKLKWLAVMKENDLSTVEPTRFPPKSAKLKRFIRKGIPPEWRGAAWFWYAGGFTLLDKHPTLYHSLVDKSNRGEMSPNDAELIERDLHRTFPDNIKFKPDPVPAGNSTQPIDPETPHLHSLRRVLRAFSIHNPRIGYCQSLNFLAGLLLLFMPEEKAFWMLVIITAIYLPGTHEISLEGANVDLWVLMTSIKESMPTIWTKIAGDLDGSAVNVNRLPPITLCTTAWFMSCFIGTLPIETTLRVWDAFFYEGSKTIFRIALAVFKVGEQEIKAVNDPMEIFQVVQTIPRRLIDANQLIDTCFRRRNGFGHLRQETIEQRRKERRIMYADDRARVAAGGVSGDGSGIGKKGDGGFREAFRRVRTDSGILKKMQMKK